MGDRMRMPLAAALVALVASAGSAGCVARTAAEVSGSAAAPAALPPAPGAVSPPTALVPEDEALAQVAPDLLQQLRDDPYVYFRFINRQWTRRVCERFADVVPSLPSVRLHGDAHLEQYAYTDTERGLDDFDDSATGPSVVDISRFLASVDLVLRRHGWESAYPDAVTAFVAGYRAGLTIEGYLPPDPGVVTRLRQRPRGSRAEFLAWAESLMIPLAEGPRRLLPAVEAALDDYARPLRPGLAPGFFRVKRAGALKLGVGSALTTKVLLRVEGPTPDPEDDVIIEAKRASNLAGVPCLSVPPAAEAVRVVAGTQQIGRLHSEVLMVLPHLGDAGPEGGTWWVRNWQPSYVEVDIDDYESAAEIVAVAEDVGAQLGSRNLRGETPSAQVLGRLLEGQTIEQLGRRMREDIAAQTAELIAAWEDFRAKPVR